MSSLIDVPAQLALLLFLALVSPDDAGAPAPASRPIAIAASVVADPAPAPSVAGADLRLDEQGWLRAVYRVGAEAGFAVAARRVFRTSAGFYYVPDTIEARAIIAMRANPIAATAITRALARHNATALLTQLGRQPMLGEIYLAHVLGPDDATTLIRLADRQPTAVAAEHLPAIARTSRALFYEGERPRTAADVLRRVLDATNRAAGYEQHAPTPTPPRRITVRAAPPSAKAVAVKPARSRAMTSPTPAPAGRVGDQVLARTDARKEARPEAHAHTEAPTEAWRVGVAESHGLERN